MNIAILDADSLGNGLNLDRFARFGTLTIHKNTESFQRLDHIRNQEILVLNRTVIDREIFQANPQLKLIALTATGFNQIDLESARKAGVAVCNIVGYSTASVAQHTLALALGLLERLALWDAHAKSGAWSDPSAPFAHMVWDWQEIQGKTWGIIGLGEIGQAVARIAGAFGARVVYHSTSGADRSAAWPRLDLEELLKTSDIVSIHSPLNEKTLGLIGTDQLGLMKKTALLLNLGRGGIVDEQALAQALDDGQLGGAALDVMRPEPPAADNPLFRLKHPERLLVTPHVAWASVESRHRCLDEVEKNIEAFLGGEKRNRVD